MLSLKLNFKKNRRVILIRKFLTGLILTFALIFLFIGGVTAQDKGLKVKINPNDDQIVLDWNDIGANYKIFEQDEEIWKGEKSRAKLTNLKPKHLYSFVLVTYDDNGKLSNTTKINTQTKETRSLGIASSSNHNNPSIEDGFVDAVFNSDKVTLKLRDSITDDDDGKIDIYKNNKLIVSTTKKTFEDKDILKGKTYNYKFVLKKKLSTFEIEKVKAEVNRRGITVTPEMELELFYEPYEYVKVIEIPKSEPETKNTTKWAPPASPASNQIGFMYRTFIPDGKVRAASLVDGWTKGYQFGGDNRGFSFNTGTSRTTTEAVVTFTSKGSKLKTRKNIGTSRLYDKKGKFIKSSPGKGSIKIEKGIANKDQLYFRIKHSAEVGFSNAPSFITPNIDYTLGILAYRDGSFSASGHRDQAPNHEFYAYVPYSEALLPLIRAKNKGFRYLAPVFPSASIIISKQP